MLKVDIYDKYNNVIKTLQCSEYNRHDLEWYALEYIEENDHAVSMGAVYESST